MIEKLTKDIINKITIQLNKKENKERIDKEIIEPLICNISNRLYPYISLMFIMYIVNLILIIVILILIIIYNK
jgi:hypothetical protein